jgi:hypothetical protein
MNDLLLLSVRAARLRAKLAAEALPNTPLPTNDASTYSGSVGQADKYLMTYTNRPGNDSKTSFEKKPKK